MYLSQQNILYSVYIIMLYIHLNTYFCFTSVNALCVLGAVRVIAVRSLSYPWFEREGGRQGGREGGREEGRGRESSVINTALHPSFLCMCST